MHACLQVQAQIAQGAHHHVRAHAPIQWHVAAGIGQYLVSRIVTGGDADLRAGCGHQWRTGWDLLYLGAEQPGWGGAA